MSSSTSNPRDSGAGTRPVTDGTVGNIGAAKGVAAGRAATGELNEAPAHPERMQSERADAAAAERDDSVPLGLHGDQGAAPNTEQPPWREGRNADEER